MMDTSDWMSGFIGFIVMMLGLVPILEMIGIVSWGFTPFMSSTWMLSAMPFVLAALGLYLAIESVVELTNSNSIGWISFFIGGAIMLIGLLPALATFGIGPGLFDFDLPHLFYYIVFVIEGIFLMLAMFAMEL